MTKAQNSLQLPKQKILIILLVIFAMLALIFALLFFNAKSDHASTAAQNQATSQNSDAGKNNSAEQNEKPNNSAADTAHPQAQQELPQKVKDAIEAQHRRDPNDPMAKGKVDAPLVIAVYADFRCGHCANYAINTEPQLAPRIKSGQVRYEFHLMPVLGPESVRAAQAAVAAANQQKFWEYHDELFKMTASGSAKYDDATLTQLAEKVGVPDLTKFSTDFTSEATAAKVQQDFQSAQQLGINGTPAFLVGYSYIPGAAQAETFNKVIDQELARKQ